jgi:hypothetical protein
MRLRRKELKIFKRPCNLFKEVILLEELKRRKLLEILSNQNKR